MELFEQCESDTHQNIFQFSLKIPSIEVLKVFFVKDKSFSFIVINRAFNHGMKPT